MPPTLYTKLLNHKLWELWVAPYNKEIMQQCYTGRYDKLSSFLIKRFHENKDIILQMYADGQQNLVPFVLKGFLQDRSLPELRKELGKGLWKSLCNNSLSRNKLVAKRSYSTDSVAHVNSLPSSYLLSGHICAVSPSIDHFTVANSKGSWSKPPAYRRGGVIANLRTLFLDTRDMAGQLSQPFNPEWSVKRMQEQHDKYVEMVNARKYSKDEWKSVQGLPDKIEYDGYAAHLVKSPYELHQEGDAMRHCVASYAQRIDKGEYLVYSLRDSEGDRVSTLGLHKQPVGDEEVWLTQQHYGKFNRRVECQKQKTLAFAVEVALQEDTTNE